MHTKGRALPRNCTSITHVNPKTLQTASYIMLEATHKPDTGVSISAVYVRLSHAMLAREDMECLCGPRSSTALSNISHHLAERGGVGMGGAGGCTKTEKIRIPDQVVVHSEVNQWRSCRFSANLHQNIGLFAKRLPHQTASMGF